MHLSAYYFHFGMRKTQSCNDICRLLFDHLGQFFIPLLYVLIALQLISRRNSLLITDSEMCYELSKLSFQ